MARTLRFSSVNVSTWHPLSNWVAERKPGDSSRDLLIPRSLEVTYVALKKGSLNHPEKVTIAESARKFQCFVPCFVGEGKEPHGLFSQRGRPWIHMMRVLRLIFFPPNPKHTQFRGFYPGKNSDLRFFKKKHQPEQ